jgi:hypothetical protein
MFADALHILGIWVVVSVVLLLAVVIVGMSIVRIGPNEVGLVIKRLGR